MVGSTGGCLLGHATKRLPLSRCIPPCCALPLHRAQRGPELIVVYMGCVFVTLGKRSSEEDDPKDCYLGKQFCLAILLPESALSYCCAPRRESSMKCPGLPLDRCVENQAYFTNSSLVVMIKRKIFLVGYINGGHNLLFKIFTIHPWDAEDFF